MAGQRGRTGSRWQVGRRASQGAGAWLLLEAFCLVFVLLSASETAAGHQAPLPAVSGAPAAAAASSPAPPLQAAALLLRSELQAASLPATSGHGAERRRAWSALRTFYARRDHRLAWWDADGNLRPGAGRLLAVLDTLPEDGFDPQLYPTQALRRQVQAAGAPAGGMRGAAGMASLDAALSFTFLTVAAHLSSGCVPTAERTREGWYAERPNVDLAAALERALGPGEDVAGALAGAEPHSPDYERLRQALTRYRALAARGGWPEIPDGPPLRPGDQGPRVAALAARLAASGELAPPSGEPDAAGAAGAGARFDTSLAAAVARFQAAHGLKPKSAGVDDATLAELNTPIAARIRQIEINLERWRWTRDPGSRYILVNIPAYQLVVVENGVPTLTMRIIVGKPHHETPVLAATLTHVVLNPPWRIPDSIASAEVAPQLLRDPDYLARKGYEIHRRGDDDPIDADALSDQDIRQLGRNGSPYRLRQPPGTANALGRYKFVIANPFDIYLHDTPGSRALFARSERAFSHGCVRLEHPADLAAYLLRTDPQWSPDAIETAVGSGRTTTVALPQPIPIYILYQTAWADPDGTIETRPDVYHQDAPLAAAFAAEPPLSDDLAALTAQP